MAKVTSSRIGFRFDGVNRARLYIANTNGFNYWDISAIHFGDIIIRNLSYSERETRFYIYTSPELTLDMQQRITNHLNNNRDKEIVIYDNQPEWKFFSRVETIEAITREVYSNKLKQGKTVVDPGQDGQQRVEGEEEFVGGEKTGRIRNEHITVITQMKPHIKYIGTKVLDDYLIPRIVMNGKHAIKVVSNNIVLRSIDSQGGSQNPDILLINMLISPFVVRIVGHQDKIKESEVFDIAGVEIQKSQVRFSGSDTTIINDRTIIQKLTDALGIGQKQNQRLIIIR